MGWQGFLAQGGDPALGTDVACQQKAFKCSLRPGLYQLRRPVLATFGVWVVTMQVGTPLSGVADATRRWVVSVK